MATSVNDLQKVKIKELAKQALVEGILEVVENKKLTPRADHLLDSAFEMILNLSEKRAQGNGGS